MSAMIDFALINNYVCIYCLFGCEMNGAWKIDGNVISIVIVG